jgi:sulfane dehydrogenase subunit SoxC
MRNKQIIFILLILLTACSLGKDEIRDTCNLDPVAVPTLPAVIPDEFELDETTNLHRSGEPQVIDLSSYTLLVTGLVDDPLELTYEQLRCMPKITATPTLNCPYTFFDTAEWSGVRLAYILNLAGAQEDAASVRLIGADGWEEKTSMEIALDPENFLAYEWEGEPLPIMHGFPLRAVFPELFGSYWVKWLVEIRVE